MIPDHSHPHDAPFIREKMAKLPFKFRPKIAGRYSGRFRSSRRRANLYLLDCANLCETQSTLNSDLLADDDYTVERAARN